MFYKIEKECPGCSEKIHTNSDQMPLTLDGQHQIRCKCGVFHLWTRLSERPDFFYETKLVDSVLDTSVEEPS